MPWRWQRLQTVPKTRVRITGLPVSGYTLRIIMYIGLFSSTGRDEIPMNTLSLSIIVGKITTFSSITGSTPSSSATLIFTPPPTPRRA